MLSSIRNPLGTGFRQGTIQKNSFYIKQAVVFLKLKTELKKLKKNLFTSSLDSYNYLGHKMQNPLKTSDFN